MDMVKWQTVSEGGGWEGWGDIPFPVSVSIKFNCRILRFQFSFEQVGQKKIFQNINTMGLNFDNFIFIKEQ